MKAFLITEGYDEQKDKWRKCRISLKSTGFTLEEWESLPDKEKAEIASELFYTRYDKSEGIGFEHFYIETQ